LQIWFIDGVECESIDIWFIFMASQTLLRAHIFSELVVLNLLFAPVFVQCDAVLIELLAEPLHVFHHVMEFRIMLHSLSRTAFQFLDKQWMTIGPFCEARFRHFVIRHTI